jgi:hypothetical protein
MTGPTTQAGRPPHGYTLAARPGLKRGCYCGEDFTSMTDLNRHVWAAALAECRARIERTIDLMREQEPSDDEKPGWYWDGWTAALDAFEEVLVEGMEP